MGKQKAYFKRACAGESNMEVRMKLIKIMVRFHVLGMTKEIEDMFDWPVTGPTEGVPVKYLEKA